MTSSTGAGVGVCRMVASPWFQTPKIEEQDAALQLLSLSPKFSPISLNGAPLQVPPPLSLDGGSHKDSSDKISVFGTRGSFEPQQRKVQRVVPVSGKIASTEFPPATTFRSIQSNMKSKRVKPIPSKSLKKVTRGKKLSSHDENKIQIDRGNLPFNLPIEYASTYNKNGYIGIYSPQGRVNMLKRYHEKRKRRSWTKLVRYNCRKKLAEKRLRVHGRFVKAGFVPSPPTTTTTTTCATTSTAVEKEKDEEGKQDSK